MTKMSFSVGLILVTLVAPAAWAQDARPEQRPGVAVDAKGNAVIDPSKNVEDNLKAEAKRQDDLRIANERLIESKIKGLFDLTSAELRRVDNEAKIRSEYEEKLRTAEKGRLDAIRAVDVAGSAEDRRRTTETATSLATQTTTLSETLRLAVVNSAAATQLTSQQTSGALSARITTLEQAGYQQAGKQTISDPAILELARKVEVLSQARTNTTGVDTGRNDMVGYIVGAIGFLLSIFMAGMVLFNAIKPSARARNR